MFGPSAINFYLFTMSRLDEFTEAINAYRQSCQELIKFNNFIKRNLKNNLYDLSAFSGGDFSKETLNSEMNSLLDLLRERNKLEIHISSFLVSEKRISIKLVRTSVFRSIFIEVSDCQSTYGSTNVLSGKVYRISCSECKSLTQLRMLKAAKVIAALVVNGGGVVTDIQRLGEDSVETIHLSHMANSSHTVLVSVVRTSSDRDLSEADLTQLRTSDMLAMSEHKDLGDNSLSQLVDAAVTFDLLSVKLEKPVCLELSSQPKPARQTNCKGAPFVLYNYARLHAILERHKDGVSKGVYPSLPSVREINYSLLSSEDEWSLVYDLVAEWPSVVAECQNLCQPPLHRLTGFLSALASTFSVYYRHTRVLNEGLKHMLPLMEARIHLLLTIKQVFLSAFSLLGLSPLVEM